MIHADITKAYHNGRIPQQDTDFILQAWKEMEASETYNDYGIVNYDMKFK